MFVITENIMKHPVRINRQGSSSSRGGGEDADIADCS